MDAISGLHALLDDGPASVAAVRAVDVGPGGSGGLGDCVPRAVESHRTGESTGAAPAADAVGTRPLAGSRRRCRTGRGGDQRAHRLVALPEGVGLRVWQPRRPARLSPPFRGIGAIGGDGAPGGAEQGCHRLQSGRPRGERRPDTADSGLARPSGREGPVHPGELRRTGNRIERATALRTVCRRGRQRCGGDGRGHPDVRRPGALLSGQVPGAVPDGEHHDVGP